MKSFESMKYLYVLIFCSVLFSQTHITVHRSKTAGNTISQLEEFIIKNTILLYNKSNKNKLSMSFKNHSSFLEMLNILDERERTDSVHVVMNSLTITEERKKRNMFSSSYLPVKNVLIRSKKHVLTSDKYRRIGFLKGSIQEEDILGKQTLNKIYIGFKSYKEMEKALLNKTIDLMITDNVDTWNNESLVVDHVLTEQMGSGYGIMYSKYSVYRNKFEKYLRYFLKSSLFKAEVYKVYGKEIADYFVKELRLM